MPRHKTRKWFRPPAGAGGDAAALGTGGGDVMDGLVTWLRAQLDDDERLAQQVILSRHGALFVPRQDGSAPAVEVIPGSRLLAEVEAKRRILDLHAVEDDGGGGGPYCLNCHGDRGYSDRPMPCATVRLLAEPYADRDGYREEWRP